LEKIFRDACFRELLQINPLFSVRYFSQAAGTIYTLGVIRYDKAPVPAAQVSAAPATK
jgi:hypothetical protein